MQAARVWWDIWIRRGHLRSHIPICPSSGLSGTCPYPYLAASSGDAEIAMASSSPVQPLSRLSGEISPVQQDERVRPAATISGTGQLHEKGRGTPLRSVSTPIPDQTDRHQSSNSRRPSLANDSDSDAGTGTETPKPFRPSLIRSNTSTRTMIRIPSQSVPPNRIGSRRPSDKSTHFDGFGENARVNADDLFEKEEDMEARTQADDFYKEFCESFLKPSQALLNPLDQLSTYRYPLDHCPSVRLIAMCAWLRKLCLPSSGEPEPDADLAAQSARTLYPGPEISRTNPTLCASRRNMASRRVGPMIEPDIHITHGILLQLSMVTSSRHVQSHLDHLITKTLDMGPPLYITVVLPFSSNLRPCSIHH